LKKDVEESGMSKGGNFLRGRKGRGRGRKKIYSRDKAPRGETEE